jgi:hypothetical protein
LDSDESLAVGRSGSVPAVTRTRIGWRVPSTVIRGHWASGVMARAQAAPFSPSTMNAASSLASGATESLEIAFTPHPLKPMAHRTAPTIRAGKEKKGKKGEWGMGLSDA